jgi:hypothetical protein
MKWVRIPIDLIRRKEFVPLPDSLWRLLVELDLLCGQEDGPVHYDMEEIAWLLHRENVKRTEKDVQELLEMGLVEFIGGGICPTGWIERNASYLHKMAYNRERYQEQKGEHEVTEESEETKRLWDAMQGNGGKPTKNIDPLGVLRESGKRQARWRRWAAGHRIVSTAPDEVQQASWLLSEHANLAPFGTRKSWVGMIEDLLTAANRDMGILESAVKKANAARAKNGITLGSPRSFLNFARSEVSLSKQNGAGQGMLIDLDEDEREKGSAEL